MHPRPLTVSSIFLCYKNYYNAKFLFSWWTFFLLQRQVPIQLVDFFLNWFIQQRFYIRWGNCWSSGFAVDQGVRQGGILSPYFFAIYVDELSRRLNNSKIGLSVLGKMMNHLLYAHDVVLLATSKSSLEKMLQISSDFAVEHGLMFNPQKSELQLFFPKWAKSLQSEVVINFQGTSIHQSTSVRYLGYQIQSTMEKGADVLTDRDEIIKRSAEMYKRAYCLRARFSKCSHEVKKYLFVTYLSSIYCCSLWMLSKSQLNKIRVTYNNCFRIVCGYRPDCSATQMFNENAVKNFYELRQLSIRSLVYRNHYSNNNLITILIDSNIHNDSDLSREWRDFLFC